MCMMSFSWASSMPAMELSRSFLSFIAVLNIAAIATDDKELLNLVNTSSFAVALDISLVCVRDSFFQI